MDTYIEKISSNVSFFDICFDGNLGWFCDVYTSTLYKLDILTNTITVEAAIPGCGNMQYGFIAKWKDILILAPRAAEKIMMYHIKKCSFTEVKLDTERMGERDIFNLFSGVHIFDDSAYLIPGRFPAIVRLDLHTFEIEYFDLWHEELKSKLKGYDERKVIFARCNCVLKDKLLLPCWQGNIVMEFQFGTGEIRFIEFLKIYDELSGMYIKDGEMFLAVKSSHMIFRCDLDGNVLEQIALQELGETGISFLTDYDGKAIAIPICGDQIVQWDFDTHESKKILNYALEEKEDTYVGEFFPQVAFLSCVKDNGGDLWMYSVLDESILRLHIATKQIERIEASLSEGETKKKAFSYMHTIQGIWEESRLFLTADFCDFIKQTDGHKTQDQCEESVGRHIFELISKE